MNLIASNPVAPSLAPATGPLPREEAAFTPVTDARTLVRMLEEVDYGIVLVTASGTLCYANQLALQALADGSPLRLAGGMLSAASAADQAQLRGALLSAARGLRSMLHLGAGECAASIAVKPLPAERAANDGTEAPDAQRSPALAMLVFGKRHTCETLTLDIFARTQKLTGAEGAVLRALCLGQRPKQIAAGAGVAISTVRTQINSIRVKTRTNSIRELVDRVAALPPITPAMKSVVCH